MGQTENEPILATGGYDHTIKIWSPHSATSVKTLQHSDSQVNTLAIKNYLAAGGFQSIRLYDLNSSTNPIINFEGVSKNVTTVGFQEDGRFMFTGSEDSRVRIWDLSCPQPVCKRMFDCLAPVNSVCLHPNQVEVAISTSSGSIYIWDIKSDNNEQLLPEMNASLNCIDISPNGKFLAAINNKGSAYIWDLHSEGKDTLTKTNAKLKFVAQTRYGLKCKFSPDSTLLVTTGGDGSARIFKIQDDFKLYRELRIEKFWMWDVVFSSDSKYLFAASSDGTARLWKIETKTIEREYLGHSKALTAIAFRDEFKP